MDKPEFNKTGDRGAEVLIYSEIGGGLFGDGITSKSFVEELESLGDVADISVRINSEGGIAFEGFAIYNALVRHPATITVHVDGLAASAAAIITQAADPDRLFIADNARMMVHNAWLPEMGDKHVLRKTAARLDALDKIIIDTFVNRSGIDREKFTAMMDAETFLTASEAVELGLADHVEDPMEIAARAYNVVHMRHPPAELVAAAPNERLARVQEVKASADEVAVRMRLLDLENAQRGPL